MLFSGDLSVPRRRSNGGAWRLLVWMLIPLACLGAAFGLALVSVGRAVPVDAYGWSVLGLTVVRHLIEMLCVVYAVVFVATAVRYVLVRNRPEAARAHGSGEYPAMGVVYLCCNDLEEGAVESLSRLRYPGRLVHILHDDSVNPDENKRVDMLVARLEARTGVRWRVLRRSEKGGGKPGAMQYVLDRTGDDHELFLITDNDSYVRDGDVLTRAAGEFGDPGVGAVQFRNRARVVEEDGPFAACIAGAIDIFDAFMTGLFRSLWCPFVGHNAVLRTEAVRRAGGFTPGMFADDIDLTVRMNTRGMRVVYRRDLSMEECHPSNYRSFCLRSRKWAHGCAQIIRSHLLSVLASPELRVREKVGFLLFVGFYVAQAAVLAYIPLIFLVLPLLTGSGWTVAWWSLALGTLLPVTIFLPVGAYLLTEGKGMPFFRTLGACIVTYGTTDLWTMLGLRSGLSRRQRGWIPTNSVRAGPRPVLDWAHFGFGASLLLLPLALQPELLLFPVTWLFAGKFLFVPAVAVHYGAAAPAQRIGTVTLSTAGRAACVGFAAGLLLLAAPGAARAESGGAEPPDPPRVELRDGMFVIDGEPRLLRAVHYSPWRPGTGPGRGFDYPSNDLVEPDLRMIVSLNADAIHVYDPPARVIELAERRGLDVIHVFHVEWWRLPAGETGEIAEEIAGRVRELRDQRSVILWVVGNEIPGWIVDELGPSGVRGALREIREAVRRVDPTRPVGHGNWPLMRTHGLDIDMDVLCYNVYPFYPTEVAVSGYERFLREQIVPLAAGRPVLITEFGINTLEATPEQQARVLRECWEGLLAAGCAGGVVFSFADEWWKNYDNPILPPDWWRRVEDLDDHLTHNQDPEEHYGIVSAERVPKPAFSVVREMFASTPSAGSAQRGVSNPVVDVSPEGVLRGVGAVSVALLIGAAVWWRFRSPGGRRGA